MKVERNIHLRKGVTGFLKDIWRDAHYRYFWSNPWRHMVYRWGWHLRPVLMTAGKYPLAVDVEFANGCNFRCIMCQQSTNWLPKADETFMSWDTLAKVMDQAMRLGVHSMKVNWRGEATLDPDCGRKCLYMKMMGVHELQMNTNASKLTEELSVELIESLDRIIFSCDGISPETYNKIRRGGNFDIFLEKLKMFRQLRDLKSSKLPFWHPRKGLPVIRLNMAIMEQNHHEVPQVRKFFKDLVDEVFFNSVYQPQGSKGVNKGQKRQEKRQGCPQIWQRLIVDVRGNVMPCCVDYQEKIKMGNVHQQSLRVIWHGRARDLRNAHKNHRGRSIPGCASCDNFSLSKKNDKGEVEWTDTGSTAGGTGC